MWRIKSSTFRLTSKLFRQIKSAFAIGTRQSNRKQTNESMSHQSDLKAIRSSEQRLKKTGKSNGNTDGFALKGPAKRLQHHPSLLDDEVLNEVAKRMQLVGCNIWTQGFATKP